MTQALLPREAWPAAVESLVRIRARNETLSSQVVRHIADLCGKSPRTMWRWVQRGGVPDGERSSHLLSDAELAEYARWQGNAAAVHRELHAPQTGAPTLRTLQRAFNKLTTAEQAMMRQGVPARRREELNVRLTYGRRNELWVGDHSQLDCLVMATRGTRPVRPWSTMFIDAATKAITGWALSLQPTHATVLETLRRAVLPKLDPDQESICGCPEMFQTDNGLEFTADRVAAAIIIMGGQGKTIRPYSPHLDGLIERLHGTMDSTWLSGQPFYSGAARGYTGQHVNPLGFEPPSFDDFVRRFAAWVHSYNCDRPHSAIGGKTPLQAWNQDHSPLNLQEEAGLDWMLNSGVSRKVRDYGIEFGGLFYCHPDLNDHVGETVDVRVPINEVHFIDVYSGPKKVCRATPQDNWTEDDRQDFMAGRRRSRTRTNQARTDAVAAQVVELNQQRAHLTAPVEQARADARTATDGNLRRSSDVSLLALDTEPENDEMRSDAA